MPGSVSPGQTALTRTPSGPASTASMRASMISGALRDRVRADRRLAPHARVGGDQHHRAAASRAARAGPRGRSGTGATRFVEMTVSHCSSVVSESVRLAEHARVEHGDVEPAEPFQRGLHRREWPRSASRASARTNCAPVRAATAAPRSSSRPVKTTRAPSSVSRETIASPMPDVPPVTRARWSACARTCRQLKHARRWLPRQLGRQAEAREQLGRHEAGDAWRCARPLQRRARRRTPGT